MVLFVVCTPTLNLQPFFSRSMDADKTEEEQKKRDNEYILETTEEQRRLYNLIQYGQSKF